MMKFYLSSCAIFLLSITAVSQDLPSTSSKIKEVTVFLNGAQVHREANVNLKQGEHIIKLTGLSQSTNHNSIQVEGNRSDRTSFQVDRFLIIYVNSPIK